MTLRTVIMPTHIYQPWRKTHEQHTFLFELRTELRNDHVEGCFADE